MNPPAMPPGLRPAFRLDPEQATTLWRLLHDPNLGESTRRAAEGALASLVERAARPPRIAPAKASQLVASPFRWYWAPSVRHPEEDVDLCQGCLPGAPGSDRYVALQVRAYRHRPCYQGSRCAVCGTRFLDHARRHHLDLTTGACEAPVRNP